MTAIGKCIPGIQVVYTAKWILISYLPPIIETQKTNHWYDMMTLLKGTSVHFAHFLHCLNSFITYHPEPRIGAEEFIRRNKISWTLIWPPRFWTLMIWVYLNKGSRNDRKTTKRKKPGLFFLYPIARTLSPNGYPRAETPKGRDHLPRFQGW